MRAYLSVLGALLLFAGVPIASAADQLTLLEGQEIAAELTAISDTGLLGGSAVPAGLDLNSLRRIERTVAAPAAEKPTVVLDLVGGGKILATSVSVAAEKFTIQWPHGEALLLPIDAVRAVRFRAAVNDDSFEAALKKPSADSDRLFVEIDGKLSMLVGLIDSLADGKITFQYEGQTQTVATDKLFGFVVAQASAPPATDSGVVVELADGARVAGVVKSLTDGKLTITIGVSSQVIVPWAVVKTIEVRSPRLAFLSDLEPIRVDERRLVTLPEAWQRDRNIQGKTLLLGERKFTKGIGTHSYSELAFNVDGKFDGFAAVIGLDAAAEGKGDCVFVVQGDGRELLRERVTGRVAPKVIKLDIKNVKELVLIVEPGEELDLGDLADWADARVIRQK
ncbi:MAG TPA: NPCBM/NEW2 domain-containing protein [Pirellulaceae bacterium]|nr:NPCBM/NEW2 domain-containing protein [Pirellulaceae bacterium]